ncbi:MAG: ABC transporter substrate-binding protein [Candidatus Dehalobacter alkaniphilus]|uniref:ABC transporter substrate-binding protein n=1 Tax=Dehalobacter sp. DCM TaxID=2907827 RepID=UPI0030812363|nr:ABC transporter substrate-binding protein [Dehalobacter sp. DCM]
MKSKWKRIGIVMMLAACLLMLFGCSAEEEAAQGKTGNKNTGTVETITVGRPGLDIKIACIIVASEMGYYEDEGVNVQFEQISNLADGMTAVTQNKLDVLPFGVIPSATFIAQGADAIVFSGTISEGSEAITLPENAEKYKTPEDFRGKKIGCYRMETGHMVMKGVLREAGLDVNSDVQFIYLDSMQSIAEAIKKGEVDLGFVNSGYGYIAKKSGLAVAFQTAEFSPDFPCCRQTTNSKVLAEKRDALVKFMIANLRGYQTLMTDKEASIAALAKYSGQDAAYVENVIYGTDTYDAAMKISLDPNKNRVCEFYEIMKANGDIAANTQYMMEDHLDTTVYQDALNEMIKRDPNNTLFTGLMDEFKVNNQ